MILPDHRTKFTSRNRPKNKFKIFVFFSIIIAAVSLSFLFYKNISYLEKFLSKPTKNQIILDMWESQRYNDLISFSDSVLAQDPSDFEALVFKGFSSFYEGAARVNQEEKTAYIDDAVFSLRKAVLFDDKKMNPQVNYILGKAYYHKGKFYSDLSIKYLEKSLESNISNIDIYEYLGLAYADIGDNQKSAFYFEKAAELNPSDLLFLILAQKYLELENYLKAEEYLIRSNNKTTDAKIQEKNLFLLAQIYENRNDYLKAEECYLKIIENNARSADAYYHLGLLYETMGDSVKARSELRKALRVDPEHYGTRLKLF